VAACQREHEQIYSKPGWVEHDPEEIWQHTRQLIEETMHRRGLRSGDFAALGITNQRETTVLWDRRTGKPVAHAIVWQDTRVADYVSEMSRQEGRERLRAKTGLPLATYFSGLKVRWILENVPGVRERAQDGEVLFGNIDSFLVWRLTGGPNGGIHATDVTNASRTQLMNIATLSWDRELLSEFSIPEHMLPRIEPP
jgi:glycerol kinase